MDVVRTSDHGAEFALLSAEGTPSRVLSNQPKDHRCDQAPPVGYG